MVEMSEIVALRTFEEKIEACTKYLELIETEYNLIITQSDKKIRLVTITVDEEKIIEESSPVQLAYIQLRALRHRMRSAKIMAKLLGGGEDIDICLFKLKKEFEAISLERRKVKSRVEKLIKKYNRIRNIQAENSKEELCVRQIIYT